MGDDGVSELAVRIVVDLTMITMHWTYEHQLIRIHKSGQFLLRGNGERAADGDSVLQSTPPTTPTLFK